MRTREMRNKENLAAEQQGNDMTENGKAMQYGLLCAILCYISWGFLPIYWKTLVPIDSFVIIFYRTFLAGLTCFLFSLKRYGWKEICGKMKGKGAKQRHFLAGMLIATNMGLYVVAVNSNHVLQASIGYYMQPLVVSLCGIVFFKEKLTKSKLTALLLVVAGLIVYLAHLGQMPTMALGMAGVFGLYAALKKGTRLPAALSLFYEMTYFLPLSGLAILYLEVTGQGAIGAGEPYQYGLLLLSGLVTAVPLILFSAAAGKLPMITLGFIEYINPTIQLFLGVFLFGEPFDAVQLASFGFVWVGLAIFLAGETKIIKNEYSD